mgnify:CR=1 FL=1
MNADELKLITDTIMALGAEGKSAFIWYLMVKYVLSAITNLAGGAIIAYVILKIVKAVATNAENENIGLCFFRDTAKTLNIEVSSRHIYASELQEVTNAIAELKK